MDIKDLEERLVKASHVFPIGSRTSEHDARNYPVRYYFGAWFRLAATMALVLSILDLVPDSSFADPRERITFIVLWAAIMAAMDLFFARRRSAKADSPR